MISGKKHITFDDVLLEPQFSTVESRSHVDLSTTIGLHRLNLPILSANMDTITNAWMSSHMISNGGMGVLHRFMSIIDNCAEFELVYKSTSVRPWVSIGISDKEMERFEALVSHGADTFVVDVAHGAQLSVAKFVKALKEKNSNVDIIVGNFGTYKSYLDFVDYSGNVTAVKIGIGSGAACKTRTTTGSGVPQLSALLDFRGSGVRFIADGGMRTSGDIAKALAVGASAVMLGGMLAGTDETPGDILYHEQDVLIIGKTNTEVLETTKTPISKVYRGSASKESYEIQGKDWACAEGETFTVPYKGPVLDVLREIKGGLQSALAYSGAKNLKEFRIKARFIRVSSNSVIENGIHGRK